MGAWDYTPLTNDAAQDWLCDLFDEHGLAERIEATLLLDPHELGNAEESRAAAQMVLRLVKADLWPAHTQRQFVDLAAQRLAFMLAEGVYTEGGFTVLVKQEIGQLRGLDNRPTPDLPDREPC